MAVSNHIEDVFGKDKTLYEIIGVESNATNSDIRKAYFRQARCCVSIDFAEYGHLGYRLRSTTKIKKLLLTLLHFVIQNQNISVQESVQIGVGVVA